MDFTAIIGSILGIGAIVIGQWLSGGTLGQIIQFTALFVVLGGTAGAILLAFPWSEVRRAVGRIPSVYRNEGLELKPLLAEIVAISQTARKEGLLAIEPARATLKDPLLKRIMMYVVEGYEPSTVREIMDAELALATEREESAARVFEAAGSFAPTIGVIAAVLSLIQALARLNDPSTIGAGIAQAFVATIYGIGLANLVFLPWASRLRAKSQGRLLSQGLVRLGVMGLLEGLNPNAIQEKLEVYARDKR